MPGLFRYLIICFLLAASFSFAQKEQTKWYFGAYAALDFMTSPPTPLLNSTMQVVEGCASQADQDGNLLFYTDGGTVYNKNHAVMANGSGLLGTGTTAQSSLIIRKPGSSTIHYIFTVKAIAGPAGFNYSVVDMSLAAGLGSVTVKNSPLHPFPCREMLSGTMHCNQTDVWVVVRDYVTNEFRAFLVTAAGVNTSAVVSSAGSLQNSTYACMKISPSGNKLATTNGYSFTWGGHSVELFDFDNSNGIVSNYQLLNDSLRSLYGVEFSPDGSKLYAGKSTGPAYLHQWDLCAGSDSAIAASYFKVPVLWPVHTLQSGIDGRIYLAQAGIDSLSVITNPNGAGILCGFQYKVQSLGGKSSQAGLPNFINLHRNVLPPFTYTLSPSQGCHAFAFTAKLPEVSCTASNFSVTSLAWDFGDPATGPLNTSFSEHPSHVFSSSGNFTVSLIFYYKCGSDTVRQVVNVPPPHVSVSWTPTCQEVATATANVTSGAGPYSYTWMPGQQTGSVTGNLPAGSHTVLVHDQGLNCRVSALFSVTTRSAPRFTIEPPQAQICAGTVATITLKGNASAYHWQPPAGVISNGTTAIVGPPSAQQYSIIAELDSCFSSGSFSVQVLPSPKAKIITNRSTFCIGDQLQLAGEGGKNYVWNGPGGFYSTSQSNTLVINNQSGLGFYTLKVTDANSCTDTALFKVKLKAPPLGKLTGIKNGCAPLCGDFVFEPGPADSPVKSEWRVGPSVFKGHFSHCFPEPGNYVIRGDLLDTISQCVTAQEYFLEVHPRPDAEFTFTPPSPIEREEMIFMPAASQESVTSGWSFYSPRESGVIYKSVENTVRYSFEEPGHYTVAHEARNSWGCSDTVLKNITVEEDFAFYVPNTFTPDHDGRNDVFTPVVRGGSHFLMQVFNRWNQMLYQTSSPDEGWDGSFRGIPCKEDVYQYKLSITSRKGKKIDTAGHVTLIR